MVMSVSADKTERGYIPMANDERHWRARAASAGVRGISLLVARGVSRAGAIRPIVAHVGLEYSGVDLSTKVSAYCCEDRGKRYVLVNRDTEARR
jgi:hypothetical protein